VGPYTAQFYTERRRKAILSVVGHAGLIDRAFDPRVTAGNMLRVTQCYVASRDIQEEKTSIKPFPDKAEIERRSNFEMVRYLFMETYIKLLIQCVKAF
jgi:hypothetical protein